MTIQSTSELIALYQEDPSQALYWLQHNNYHTAKFFTSLNEVTALCKAFMKKESELESNVRKQIGPSVTTWGQEIKIRKKISQEINQPIDLILEKSASQIASLCTSYTEYLALVELCLSVSLNLFAKAPEPIKSLFKTFDQFMELIDKSTAACNSQKTIETHVVHRLLREVFKEPRIRNLVITLDQFKTLADKPCRLLDVLLKEPRIIDLFTTASHFSTFAGKNYYLAGELFLEPKIKNLFVTIDDFMELLEQQPFLAGQLLKEQRIKDLVITVAQVMRVVEKDLLAYGLLEEQRITDLFVTFDHFMGLLAQSHALAFDLFDNNPQKIAALFDTEAKLQKLEQQEPSLANEIRHFKKEGKLPERGLPNLTPPFDTEAKLQKLEQQEPSLAKEGKLPESAWNKESADKQALTNNRLLPNPTPPSKINSSFLLKCLAVISGIAAIVVGVLFLQPNVILLGLTVAAGSTLVLYGLFSTPKSTKAQAEQNNLVAEVP